MRAKTSSILERGRVHPDGFVKTKPGNMDGMFELIGPLRVWMRMISSGHDLKYGWEHVSVSVKDRRCPIWEEMCFVKKLFWEDEEEVMQLHPKASEYVNHHPYCLHLWRPIGSVIPTPPAVLIGPK